MEQDIWEHYQTTHPGQVQVLIADVGNGTAPQLQSFVDQIGATFPAMRNAGPAQPGGDFNVLYGPRDNYIVINKQGICRLNTYPMYAHGDRFHLAEMRACIDSLVSTPVDVPVPAAPRAFSLTIGPNPFRSRSTVELTLPRATSSGFVAVHDLSGRRVATLWEGALPAGTLRLEWDGRSAAGREVPPGVYLIRADLGGLALARRVTRLR